MNRFVHRLGGFLAYRGREAVFALLMGLCLLLGLHGVAGESRATVVDVSEIKPMPSHLVWVEGFLDTEQKRVLELLTDASEGAFVPWYEGEGREYVVERVPALAGTLKNMDLPLSHLRYTLQQIAVLHKEVDPEMPGVLDHMEVANLAWAARVYKAIAARKESINLEKNPGDLGIGRLITGEKGRLAAHSDVVLGQLLTMLEPVHLQLHGAGMEIDKVLAMGDDVRALAIYQTQLVPALRKEQGFLSWFRTRVKENLEAHARAERLMVTDVLPDIDRLQGLLAHVTRVSGTVILHQDTVAQRGVPLKPWNYVLIGDRFDRFFPGRPPRRHKALPYPDRVVILRNIWKLEI